MIRDQYLTDWISNVPWNHSFPSFTFSVWAMRMNSSNRSEYSWVSFWKWQIINIKSSSKCLFNLCIFSWESSEFGSSLHIHTHLFNFLIWSLPSTWTIAFPPFIAPLYQPIRCLPYTSKDLERDKDQRSKWAESVPVRECIPVAISSFCTPFALFLAYWIDLSVWIDK